ncbi:MAG: DMT family transporter [Alphaproteobacteria bacterium]
MTSPLFPVALALVAVAMGSLLDAGVKLIAAQGLSVLAILFWRFLISGIVIGAAFRLLRQPGLSARILQFHALRGLVHATMAGLFFYGITQIPLAEATTLGFTAVLMAGPLERLFLGQPLRARTVWAALIGFSGVLVIALRGEPAAAETGNVIVGRLSCLASAFLYALSLIMLRARAKADGTFAIAMLSNIIPACWLAIPTLALTPLPAWEDFPGLAAISVVGSAVWVLMTMAYARAPAQRLAPLEYSSLLWSALFGWILFGEMLGPTLWFGAGLIVAGCLLTVLPDRRALPPAPPIAGPPVP